MTAAVVETQKNSKLKSTLKLDFKFDSMTLVLYSPNENVVIYTHTHTQKHAFKLILLSLSNTLLMSYCRYR